MQKTLYVFVLIVFLAGCAAPERFLDQGTFVQEDDLASSEVSVDGIEDNEASQDVATNNDSVNTEPQTETDTVTVNTDSNKLPIDEIIKDILQKKKQKAKNSKNKTKPAPENSSSFPDSSPNQDTNSKPGDNDPDPDPDPVSDDQEQQADVLSCPTETEMPCSNPNAFDDPACFIKTVKETIESEQQETTQFYVAISQEAYQAQGLTGCPFALLDAVDGSGQKICPFGHDDNDGLSVAKPKASFWATLYAMYEHKEVTKKGHYTLVIRGGEFVYYEPLIVAADFYLNGKTYRAPLYYDDKGNVIKKDTEGNVLYKNKPATQIDYENLDDMYSMTENIHIKNFMEEAVLIDGACTFDYPYNEEGEQITPDHEDWTPNEVVVRNDDGELVVSEVVMTRSCSADVWPDPDNPYVVQRGMVTLFRGRNIEVEGLNVINSPSNGFVLFANENVYLHENFSSNTYNSGIKTVYYNTNVLIEDNFVEKASASSKGENVNVSYGNTNVAVYQNTVTAGHNAEAICVYDDVENVFVYDNHVYDNASIGIYVSGGHEGAKRILIDSNDIHDNGTNCVRVASEWRGLVEDIQIQNNLCYENDNGMWVNGHFQPAHEDYGTIEGVPMNRIKIVNNTIWHNYKKKGYSTIPPYGLAMSNVMQENVFVINNIIAQNEERQIYLGDEVLTEEGVVDINKLILKNNITFCDDKIEKDELGNLVCLTDGVMGSNIEYPGEIVLQKRPLFVDAENGNFKLSPPSPAINAGINNTLVPEYDFECQLRLDTKVDIGADEYVE